MNTAVTFDTLKFVETLEAANITGEQARAIAAAVRDVQHSADVATRGDLHALETRLDAKIDKVDTKLDMLKWLLVLLTALTIAPFIKSMF